MGFCGDVYGVLWGSMGPLWGRGDRVPPQVLWAAPPGPPFLLLLSCAAVTAPGRRWGDGDGGTACGVRGVMAAYGDTATP